MCTPTPGTSTAICALDGSGASTAADMTAATEIAKTRMALLLRCACPVTAEPAQGSISGVCETGLSRAFAPLGILPPRIAVTTSRSMNRTNTFGLSFDTLRSPSREERIARLDALATLLDTAFVVPGTQSRFGLDALIGLVPGIGDAITTAISLYIVNEAR